MSWRQFNNLKWISYWFRSVSNCLLGFSQNLIRPIVWNICLSLKSHVTGAFYCGCRTCLNSDFFWPSSPHLHNIEQSIIHQTTVVKLYRIEYSANHAEGFDLRQLALVGIVCKVLLCFKARSLISAVVIVESVKRINNKNHCCMEEEIARS